MNVGHKIDFPDLVNPVEDRVLIAGEQFWWAQQLLNLNTLSMYLTIHWDPVRLSIQDLLDIRSA